MKIKASFGCGTTACRCTERGMPQADRESKGRHHMMIEDRFLKRLRKKARKGMRGWPMATVAFYGPNLNQATKVAVGIMPSENAEMKELRDWKVDRGDIHTDPTIAREILEFMEKHGVLSVVMTDGIIGCPLRLGMDRRRQAQAPD